MQLAEKKYWKEGLNSDDSPLTFPPTAYCNMRDFRFGNTSNVYGATDVLESVGSTILLANDALPTGNNIRIGSAADREKLRILYFLWNDAGNHSIFCYDLQASATYIVLLDAQVTGGLNFDQYSLIHSAFVLNGCLYWTDNLNEPRRLDIDAAIAMNQPALNQNQVPIIYNQGIPPPGTFLAVSYDLFDGPSLEYGPQILAQLTRTGTGGPNAAATVIPIALDWTVPGLTPAQVVRNGIRDYLLTLDPGGTNFIIQQNFHTISLQIRLTWDWTTGGTDPTFPPTTSLTLQLYSLKTQPYVAPVDDSVISWIRRQPGMPPSALKITQSPTTIPTNFIQDEAFEFCYRYVYRNYETGTLSGLSPLANFNFLNDTYNAIQVAIPLQEPIMQDVIQVDLVAKFFVGGTYFIIKSWQTAIVADDAEIAAHNAGTQALTFIFNNSISGIPLDASYSVKPFDSVPLIAKTVAPAKNRAFMGNYTLGYDTPVETSLTLKQIPATITANVSGEWFFLRFLVYYGADPRIPRGTHNVSAYIIYIAGYGYYYPTQVANRPTAAPFPTTEDYTTLTFLGTTIQAVMTFIAVNNGIIPAGQFLANTQQLQYVDQNAATAITRFPTDVTGSIAQGLRVMKSATTYQAGTVFFDEFGRKCGLVTNSGLIVSTPETRYDNGAYTQQIQWNLNGDASLTEIPFWAHYYAPLLTLSLRTRFFAQARVANASYAVKDYTNNYVVNAAYLNVTASLPTILHSSSTHALAIGPIDFTNVTIPDGYLVGQRIRAGDEQFVNYVEGQITALDSAAGTMSVQVDTVKGSGILTQFAFQFVQVNFLSFDISSLNGFGLGYVFTDGDVLKLYHPDISIPVLVLDVLAQVGSWVVTSFADLGNLTSLLKDNRNFAFEIFTPFKPSTEEPYYEQGQIFPVVNPGTPIRAYSVTSGFFNGDVSIIKRSSTETNSLTVQPVSYLTENMSPDDKFWKNWYTDAGRPNFIDTIGQVSKENSIAYSNTFIQGSRVNGLSTFDALDTKALDNEFGTIQRLILTSKPQKEGSIMLAICSVETASLYLGENIIQATTGEQIVAQTTDIIGYVNPLRGSYGTKNPESAVEFRGNVYWADIKNGKYVQYADNGLFPISNYKMTRYWKLYSAQYNSMTPQEIAALNNGVWGVFGGIDPHNEELMAAVPTVIQLSIITPNVAPKGYFLDYNPPILNPFDVWDGQGKTLVYKIMTNPNKWQGSYSLPNPEGFEYVEDQVFSWSKGLMYQMNDENSFCNYFGQQFTPQVMPILNEQPTKPKVWNAINVQANFIPTFTLFRAFTPFEQGSDLLDTDYADTEGVYYSTLFQDRLSPGFDNNIDALFRGNNMRSTALYVMLQFDASKGLVQVREMTVAYALSYGHVNA